MAVLPFENRISVFQAARFAHSSPLRICKKGIEHGTCGLELFGTSKSDEASTGASSFLRGQKDWCQVLDLSHDAVTGYSTIAPPCDELWTHKGKKIATSSAETARHS